MRKIVLAGLAAACLGAGFTDPIPGPYADPPPPGPNIRIWNMPIDVSHCRRLARLSGPVPTGPAFDTILDTWVAETIALGGADLLLRRTVRRDWAYVEGVAYRCGRGPRPLPRAPVLIRKG